MKARFVIIGSGWRAGYYIRIAKALPEHFELCAVFCRTQTKAQLIAQKFGVYATNSIQECVDLNPDFVVVAVSKSLNATVALEWIEKGFFVLAETPAALDFESLKMLRLLPSEKSSKLIIAEQYRLYPQNRAILSLLKTGLLGTLSCVNISLAHDYHAASLIRAFLDIDENESFEVTSKNYEFPVTKTLTRYENFTDGSIETKQRTVATFEFKNGKVAFYDFDSEQYRSPIRKNTLKIQGTRGEIIDDTVYYLNKKNEPCKSKIYVQTKNIVRDDENPNFKNIEEVEKITFEGKILYEAPFGLCDLSQDETALALLMKKIFDYKNGTGKIPYALKDALQDSFMAIKMRE